MSLQKVELEVYKKLCQDFKVVFDVGSRDDIDYFLAKNDCEYHLFEPNTEALNSIKKKIALLGPHKIIVNEFGLSNENKDNCIYYKNVQSFIPHWSTPSLDSGERFSLRKLDDYVKSNKIEHIDFLKIDVEGLDYSVVLGGIDTIKNSKKVSYIQVENSGGVKQYIDLLNNFNFYILMELPLLTVINTVNNIDVDFNKSLVKLDDNLIHFMDKKLFGSGAAVNLFGVNKSIDFISLVKQKSLISNMVEHNKSSGRVVVLYFLVLYRLKHYFRPMRNLFKKFFIS